MNDKTGQADGGKEADGGIEKALKNVALGIVNLAREAGLADESPAAALPPAIKRLGEDRAAVVVVGEVSKGKSTLINALLGKKWLPDDFRATTSTWVQIRHGAAFGATVYLIDDRDRLVQIELRNPDDLDVYLATNGERERRFAKKHRDARVVSVDLRVPADVLAGGLEILDTPGVGGLRAAHRAAALAALDQADAVLFVTKPGEPLSRSELSFFAAAGEHVSAHVLVQTHDDKFADGTGRLKADRATFADPATWASVIADKDHAAEVAGRFASIPGVSVSATLALKASALTDGSVRRELYEDSHLPALREILEREVLARSHRLHMHNVRSLSRAALRAITADAQEQITILKGEAGQEALVVELEERLNRWLAADGDYWREGLDSDYEATAEKIRDHVRERARSLDKRYRRAFSSMSRDDLKEVVENVLVGEPEAELIEVIDLVNRDMAKATARIRALLESEGILGGFAEASGDGRKAGQLDGWELASTDVDLMVVRDAVVGGMAGVGVASALVSLLGTGGAAGGAAAAGVAAAAAPIFWPFVLGAGVFVGINYLRRRKERSVEAAVHALDQVVDAIQGTAYETGISILAEVRNSIVRDVGIALAAFKEKVERARRRLEDAALMDAGQRTRRIQEAEAQAEQAASYLEDLDAIPES